MPKYKDAIRILRRRIEFFRGEVYDAEGKELMYRVLASEPELEMLEYIENQYEPTNYEFKPGKHVDFITPEICLFVRLIYSKLTQPNGKPSGTPSGTQDGPAAGQDRSTPGGGEPARKRHKAGDAGGDGNNSA